MTPAAFATELAATADEALWRTNPVWCLERLVKRWAQRDASRVHLSIWLPRLVDLLARNDISLPRSALDRWASHSGPFSASEGIAFVDQPYPGVVGLIVDVGCQEAWVVPLAAERAAEWAVAPTLPFHPATALQDLFIRLLAADLDLPHLRAVPERFAFTLRDRLGRSSNGPSMHVAGLLAVVREANGRPPELDRACAVVQLEGDRLVPVGSIRPKLDAFFRECGSGTLLVRGRACAEAREYDDHFVEVWKVDSLAELAQKLRCRGWLDVFLTGLPLTRAQAESVFARVRRLRYDDYHYADALALSDRAELCGFGPDVPNRLRREYEHAVIDLTRLLGSAQRSAERADVVRHRAWTSSRAPSYEDRARADLNYAAALFALHLFREIRELLDPWRERLAADPLLVTPFTRVKVFNTLGRALVAADEAGWEELFHDTAEVMTELEPTDVPRTWCYLAHGYLRCGRLPEAEEVLRWIEVHDGLDELTRRFFCFHRAGAARCRGEQWTDPDMERVGASRELAHLFGYCWQATARQPGRDADDALDRFCRAQEFLARDIPPGDDQNIRRFLIDCVRLAEAARASDRHRWDESVVALGRHLAPRPGLGLSNYYAGYAPAPGAVPTREAAERLLNRVPFF
jgi:hypothetical protein